MRKCAAYAFKDPEGNLMPETVAPTLPDLWHKAGLHYGLQTRERVFSENRKAYKKGFRVVRLTEVVK